MPDQFTVIVGKGSYNIVLANRAKTHVVRVAMPNSYKDLITDSPFRTLKIATKGSEPTRTLFRCCREVLLTQSEEPNGYFINKNRVGIQSQDCVYRISKSTTITNPILLSYLNRS